MAEKLDAGTAFPEMILSPVDGEPIKLPGDIHALYQIVLFYRGHW